MSGMKVVTFAKKFLGTPYIYGGASPAGFDFEGLVIYCYKRAIGVDLPKYTNGLLLGGTKISQANLKHGDLVFTSSSHVGIYAGDNKIIHAPKTGEVVKISEIVSFYTARRYVD